VSFGVGHGEVLGLAGLVGARRSEVARAIFGVDATAEREIALAGKPLHIESPQDAIKEGIYLVPEDRRTSGLIVDFTVRENVSLPGLDRCSTAGLINSTKERTAAKKACQSINVKASSPEMKAANLSGGNQQKVDRMAVMHEGRIAGILNRDQFTEEAIMRLATGGVRE